MKRFFTTLLLVTLNLFSLSLDNNTSLEQNSTIQNHILEAVSQKEPSLYQKLLSLDYMQSSISRKVLIFSSKLDESLEKWLRSDTNASSKKVIKSIEEEKDAYRFYSIVNLYDKFFQDETYLSTTNKSYLRIRFGVEENVKDKFSYLNNIRMKLRLPKTEESFHLFIGDEEDENRDTIKKSPEDIKTSIGIQYLFDTMDVFNANIYGGFRGIDNPFIKFRMEYPIVFKHLLFRPVQYFEYSRENRFKEETKFYFDHRLSDNNDLIRLTASRSTQTYLKGIHYSTQLSYLNTIKYGIGFQIYTNLSGRTKLTGNEPINPEYNITPTTGVYDYRSGIIWKQQFFKKYLFYELHPTIQYTQEYDYNANYILRANIELYFGNI
ncbi:MAG: hypothetical protein ABFQ64_00870 [Campylobacterota bacterium]